MPNRSEEVNRFMEQLEHPLKVQIEQMRDLILGADEHITEHIKWNAPSYKFQGEDRLTFNLRPRDRIQLIFHRGAKVKDSQGFTFEDSTGLLEWVAADRAMLTIRDQGELEANKFALANVVSQWIKV